MHDDRETETLKEIFIMEKAYELNMYMKINKMTADKLMKTMKQKHLHQQG